VDERNGGLKGKVSVSRPSGKVRLMGPSQVIPVSRPLD
jgi:hypothetical protein